MPEGAQFFRYFQQAQEVALDLLGMKIAKTLN